jgi:lipopolysaccharide biosynthesis glycosyltransferase
MFRGDARQLLQWCNFHLNAGVAQLYVLLDCPGHELVSALPVHSDVRCEVLDQQTWDNFYPAENQTLERKQVDGFRWIARRAAADGHDYLAFVDVDELISLGEPFPDIARHFPGASAITIPVKEMWYADPESSVEPFAATLALRSSSGRQADWWGSFGWRTQFLRNGLLGHDAGKTIYRLPLAAGEVSVHQPHTGSLAARCSQLPATSGALLHFDCGSVSTWNTKWTARLQGRTMATGLGPQRLAQQRLFTHVLRQPPHRQEAFFRSFFTIDQDGQARLAADVLLERVDVRNMVNRPLPVTSKAAHSSDAALVRLPDSALPVRYQFALVCDKRFSKPTFATMTSVLAQVGDKGSVRFVVLGDGLDGADISRLRALEQTPYDVQVIVHDITTDLDHDVGTEDPKRTTFGRTYLIDYLPEQRTVYLDGDVLATRDFTELFELDLGTACIAGVPDSAALRLDSDPRGVPIQQRMRLMGITHADPLEYLNGGVLIFDLPNPDFRGLALEAKALVVTHGHTLKQRDQDAINLAFSGRKYRLDSKYNYMTQFYASDRCLDDELVRLKYDAADASLIHFSGRIKPWETRNDEFYNGLYRRLVAAAEQRVGVSCEFYFSQSAPPVKRTWTVARWVEALGSPAGRPAPLGTSTDIEVLDLFDQGAYLRLSSAMYDLAHAAGLKLIALSDDQPLFEVSLDHLGPSQTHLAERVTGGIRILPLQLPALLAHCDGVARHVELAITSTARDRNMGFVRSIGGTDVLAAGSAATAALLPELAVDGLVEAVSGGYLTGWFRPRHPGAREAVSLYMDGELAAQRVPELRRDDLGEQRGTRGFRFNVANLIRLGYGNGGDISVRVAGTNIPLRGAPLQVGEVEKELRYDETRDAWVNPPSERTTVVERVRRRVTQTWGG